MIRTARPDDARAIAHVQVRTWRATYRGMMPQPYLDGLDEDEHSLRWRDQLALPGRLAYVAEAEEEEAGEGPDRPRGGGPPEGGRVVGFASGGPERGRDPTFTGEVYAVYVLPEWQGRGLGRALVGAMAAGLAALGHASLLIWVLRDNHASRRFYERLGGVYVRERLLDFGAGFEVVEAGYGWPGIRGTLVPA